MPKTGMEPLRRDAIVRATIAAIADAGSLDVTVGQIANRAGMSTSLAHHYFGGKGQIFLAAMRRILSDFGQEVREELNRATPDTRTEAIVRGCFKESCFTPQGIRAWLTFYGLIESEPEARRLWQIYQNRLRSNLRHSLRQCQGGQPEDPAEAAETLAAQIDGLYLRAALEDAPDAGTATRQALHVLSLLKRTRH